MKIKLKSHNPNANWRNLLKTNGVKLFLSPWPLCFAWWPKAWMGKGTYLKVCGVLLHIRWLGRKIFRSFWIIYVGIYIGIYSRIPVTQVCCVQSWGLVCCWLRSVLKQIDLVLFFFPLCGFLASCLHHLNTEASKLFKTGKGNGFLGACNWFHFCRTS